MIQLYVKNQLVDITESVGLFLNKKFEDVNNPTLYFADYSKTITLPMTANNKKIFDNYNRQDSVVTTETIDPRRKIPFQLLYNSQLVMEGYMKINNANTILTDNKYCCELFSQFGLIMQEIGEMTFNKYECQSYGGDKDDKYLIQSPWMDDLKVDRNLVKDSFEQTLHSIYGEDILDYIKFIPTYQGKYPDFESGKEEILTGRIEDLSRERDEHYIREFRSYYQQPSIWVDKLWKMAKDKIEEITDYEFVLDPSWFNTSNPYYTKLIYTCPSLFEEDDNFREIAMNFNADSLNYHVNITTQSNLSSHHSKKIYFSPNGELYNGGTFNQSKLGQTSFTWNGRLQLACPVYTNMYAKIREDNPLYIKFYAVNAETNQAIPHASHTYMLYSCDYNDDISSNTFDDAYDVKVVSSDTVSSGDKPSGYTNTAGWWFQQAVGFTLNITENVPYYIACDCYFCNNGCGIECSSASWTPRWDWMWTDKFYEGSGYHIFANMTGCSVKTSDYKRSHTKIDMYRVFPKDTTLLKVLLNYSKMFGLCWDVDQDNKKITVMSRNRFFSGYEVLDWSDKVDRSKDFILEPLCFSSKYVSFNIEEGSGGRLEKYMSKYGVGYGAKKIDTEYQFNTDTEDLFEDIQPSIVATKSQFSRMTNTEYPDADQQYAPFMGYNYKIKPNEQYVDNDDDGDNAGNFGAFYFWNGYMTPDSRLGFTSTSGYPCVFVSDDTDYQMSHGEYMWNMTGTYEVLCYRLPKISTISQSGNWSIHFESPKEYYFEKPNGEIKYIYNEFWKNYINERYNVQNKKLTAYFYLTPEDYKKINFRQFVKIENTLYHINKIIDYDFDTNSPTKVELVQVWDINAYTNGQHSWPDLSVTPDTLEISFHEYKPIEVFSSINWVVAEKPTWISYYIDQDNPNRIWVKANSDPLRSRTGVIKIQSTSSWAGIHLQDVVLVTQKPYNTYINLNPTTATANRNGDTITVNIDSRPDEVVVLSKPRWCDVNLRSVVTYPILPYGIEMKKKAIGNVEFEPVRRTTIDSVNAMRINRTITTVATISVNANNGYTQRTGVIRFSNGNITKDFTIKQIGNRIVPYHFDDEIIHVDINDTGVWNLRCEKEIDPTSIKITRGTVSQTSNNVVDKLQMSFTPQLLQSQDMTETCTGGQVTFKTMDGKTVTANYNYGSWLQNYNLTIGPFENGKITVDGVDYTSTYFESLPTGTTVSITATPDDGSFFQGWSDGVQTASRTVTIGESDVEIYPIFDSDYILYDNKDNTEFDDSDLIKYK